ncbi:leukocyte cell-derived chemotaxin-2-like [Enoplosus armatus]|uniref:leukocyte cell-derived chemotaxin-2-like n=1 Tax=Enoplosus armatus TaxID=215367 RepID=UPI003994E470
MAVFLITAVLSTVVLLSAGYEFGPICCSNPTNRIRGSDTFGSGGFGASRGSRSHAGVDIECQDGSRVYAPLDMTIIRQSTPYKYGTKTAINNGIVFEAEGMTFKLWYIRPVKTSGTVTKGELIGTMLPMQSVYQRITSHVHLEKSDKTDPMAVINTQNQQSNRNFCIGK